jgi:hypothetical protein
MIGPVLDLSFAMALPPFALPLYLGRAAIIAPAFVPDIAGRCPMGDWAGHASSS